MSKLGQIYNMIKLNSPQSVSWFYTILAISK